MTSSILAGFVFFGSATAMAASTVSVASVANELQLNSQDGDYSGLTPDGISCQVSVRVRGGQLESSLSWGDTGARVRAPLTSVAQKADASTYKLSDVEDATTIGTLTISNGSLMALTVEMEDPIWIFPRHLIDTCEQLVRFYPHN